MLDTEFESNGNDNITNILSKYTTNFHQQS